MPPQVVDEDDKKYDKYHIQLRVCSHYNKVDMEKL